MGITIAQGSPQSIWVPIKDATTIYVGGLVSLDLDDTSEGVIMLPDASGVANATNQDVPYGVCIGTNLKTSTYNTTEKCDYITGPAAADPHDGASKEYVGVEGPYSKGDPIAMVKIAVITPSTVLKAPLYYGGTAGTVPTERTLTAGSTDGLTCDVAASDFTPTADCMQTIYFRTGACAGTYRMINYASATDLRWDTATVADPAVGDKIVMVPLRTHGISTVCFDDTTMSWIDTSDAPVLAGTARWSINVLRLDLRESGKEFVEFMFDASHLCHFVTTA